jgi:hypothetical protein
MIAKTTDTRRAKVVSAPKCENVTACGLAISNAKHDQIQESRNDEEQPAVVLCAGERRRLPDPSAMKYGKPVPALAKALSFE